MPFVTYTTTDLPFCAPCRYHILKNPRGNMQTRAVSSIYNHVPIACDTPAVRQRLDLNFNSQRAERSCTRRVGLVYEKGNNLGAASDIRVWPAPGLTHQRVCSTGSCQQLAPLCGSSIRNFIQGRVEERLQKFRVFFFLFFSFFVKRPCAVLQLKPVGTTMAREKKSGQEAGWLERD